jgi:hypothetical protein
MIHPEHLRSLVIRPVLQHLGLYSLAAEDLLVGTAMQESRLGRYLRQHPTGPARGIYQMEPLTHDDLWRNFIRHRFGLMDRVSAFRLDNEVLSDRDELHGNLYYATAMARVHYLRAPERLPEHQDIAGYARYWKKWYNTPLGKGTEHEFIRNWNRIAAIG